MKLFTPNRTLIFQFFILTIILTFSYPVQATPITLVEADTQAFVQDSGAIDTIYTLRYEDKEGRSEIRAIGQFYEPVAFNHAVLRKENQEIKVRMSPNGGGYYRASFASAVPRGTYELELHYRSDKRFAEPTKAGDKDLLAVWFNPVRWTMPIQKSIIKLVLPLPLTEPIQRHEDITPAMVDAFGLLTDPDNKAAQDHFAFVYTDYRDSRRLTIYAEKQRLPAEATHMLRVYVPRSTMPNLAATDITRPRTAAGPPAPREPVPRTLSSTVFDFVLFLVLTFLFNGFILFFWLLIVGPPLAIIDRIAKTKLVRDIFIPGVALQAQWQGRAVPVAFSMAA